MPKLWIASPLVPALWIDYFHGYTNKCLRFESGNHGNASQGPCDFNLHLVTGESLLMVAAQQKHPDVLTFLIQELKKVKVHMIVTNPVMFPR